jgi:3-hydroxyisobutyrate dehydrogenase
MSTVGRDDILRLAAQADANGVATLEAPVTGGVHRAAADEITILCGGPEQLLEAHRSALAAMGGEILHVGPLGSAALMKVVTNMLAFVHLVAAGEALMLAKRGGIDLHQAYHAIKASSGNSFVHQTESQLILMAATKSTSPWSARSRTWASRWPSARNFGRSLGSRFDDDADLHKSTGSLWQRGVVDHGCKAPEDALRTDLRAPGFPAELVE